MLLVLVSGSLALALSLAPIPQDLAYHDFADQRAFAGIPNALNVLSNLPFLLVGMLGLRFSLAADTGAVRMAWIVLFAGIALVAIGSSWYHWHPDNESLVWDRLPMAVGFMGLFAALVSERLQAGWTRWLLMPAVLLGAASVIYWQQTDDLRLYAWVQFMPLLVLPALVLLFGSRYANERALLFALLWYLFAKLAEFFDVGIFELTGRIVSGHTLKHLAAALACFCILLALQQREAHD